MRSPLRFMLPLIVHSSDGAPAADAAPSRISCAFVGPPAPRGNDRAGPKPGARLAGLGLVLIVGVRVANKCECPSVPHHPFLNVLAINGAARERATVAIRSGDAAGPRLVANVADEFIAGADAASPSAAFGVET